MINKATGDMNWMREIPNVSYRRRLRQVVVLIFTIIIGILISQSTRALRTDAIERHHVIEKTP